MGVIIPFSTSYRKCMLDVPIWCVTHITSISKMKVALPMV